MKLLAFVPIKLTLFLIIGILISHYFPFDLYLSLGTSIILCIVLGFLLRFYQEKYATLYGATVAVFTISLGVFIGINNQPNQHASHYSKLDNYKNVAWHIKIKDVLKPTTFSNRYIASVQAVNQQYATGNLLVSQSLSDSLNLFSVDDELWLSAKAMDISPPLNPHQFDYKNHMENLGVYHQIKLNPDNFFIKKNSKTTLFGIAHKTRSYIISKLKQEKFGTDELSVIQALVLGQRSDISTATYNNYKNAGAVHILAVSGLHIGILLLLIEFLLRPLRRMPKGRTIILFISVLLLWGFAFLAGLSASIIRACAMFTFVAYARFLNRPGNTFNILALSMFFLLLFVNPSLLFQVGFQMSYAAVFAIAWIYPLLQKIWFPKQRMLRYVWQLLSVSIAAQLGVLPISLFYFHQFPGLFFISNLLIVPVLGILLGMGILVVALSVMNALPDWLVILYDKLISLMNNCITWVAQQEQFIFKSISFDCWQLVLTYLMIISFVVLASRINFRRTVIFLGSILCFQLYTFYLEYRSTTKPQVLLAYQTKNSVLLHKNGKELTVLSGNPKAPENIVRDYAIGERISTINYGSLANSYIINDKSVVIIDSLGTYSKELAPDIVVLTSSPKINLERLLETVAPDQIIADGSNYKTYVDRWKRTCQQYNTPFHYTGEKGAYTFVLK